MKTTNLTDQELEQIRDLQKKHQAIIQELGNIELAKIDLNLRRDQVEKYLKEVLVQEKQLAQHLESTYGKGTIDLQQGEITNIQQ